MLIRRRLSREFQTRGHQVTFEQWQVLSVLLEHPGIIQNELGERTSKDKTNITRILDVLARRGYLERRRHDGDRRSQHIYLTDAGAGTAAELKTISASLETDLRSGMSGRVLRFFFAVLDRLCRNAER